MADDAEARRLLARIADLRAMAQAQEQNRQGSAAASTRREIAGLEAELAHHRGQLR